MPTAIHDIYCQQNTITSPESLQQLMEGRGFDQVVLQMEGRCLGQPVVQDKPLFVTARRRNKNKASVHNVAVLHRLE